MSLLSRLMPVALVALLAACAAPPAPSAQPTVVPGYEARQDGEFLIPAVESRYLNELTMRTQVAYSGPEEPGTIVVDPFAKRLYLVMEGGQAMRYGIAVGRAGLAFKGTAIVGRKQEWPSWTPTANMIRMFPEMYSEYAGGLPGGLSNPLGARALYLYRNGRDTYFRIHGTIQNASIGQATSAGCIRLFNQDAIDLYNRVPVGTFVTVRTLEQSVAMEGPFMDDAFGRAVPATPENMAKKERDLARLAEQGITPAAPQSSVVPPAQPSADAGAGAHPAATAG